jgi:hypothetical protein
VWIGAWKAVNSPGVPTELRRGRTLDKLEARNPHRAYSGACEQRASFV